MSLRSVVAAGIITGLLSTGLSADDRAQTLAKAAHLFGAPLSSEHTVFQFNGAYLVWLIFDTHGELFDLTLQPISDDHLGVLASRAPSGPARMSETEYREALERLSKLKDLGTLIESHGSNTLPGHIGSFNTDRFEQAFVDRVLTDDGSDVRRLDVHFLQEMAGPWMQVSNVDGRPMVCLGYEWYYLSPAEARKVEIGTWQTLQVAGPSLYSGHCFRTGVLHDEDGFIIEEPANMTILLDDIHVKALAGKVHLESSQEGVPDANVELLRIGSKKVIGRKTDDSGHFSFGDLAEGKYKLKITKDGFKSLSGFVFLDHTASTKNISFALPVGT